MASSFDDGKDEGALRTIGEVGEALGIKAHVLRYWEGQFPQLQPMKRSGGRRYYRPEDVAIVREIDRLVNREGYTIKGAVAALRGRATLEADVGHAPTTGEAPGGQAGGTPTPERRTELVGRLKSIRTSLAEALAS